MFNTDGFHLIRNTIADTRDGIYIQSSPHGVTIGNVARDLRYGLHYMFSDDNTFEDNRFERGDAGAALMYSRRLTFRRNQFVHNRGFASVGLLLQVCDDVVAEDNLIADNARGVFMEGVRRNTFRGNAIAESDVALVLYDSARDVRFQENSFVGNLSPVQFVGRRTDTVFDHNYWSDNTGLDLDGDGVQDSSYRLSSVFDHLRGNLTAADLFAQGLGATVLARAEQVFPVLDPSPLADAHPLARAPELSRVPRSDAREGARHAGPIAGSVGALAFGLWLFVATDDVGKTMIAFERFSKSFGRVNAVCDLNVTINRGEVVALLGPNGSGKTTSIKAAAGLVLPTRGQVLIGPDRRVSTSPSARNACSFLPQKVSFPEGLTGREVLEFYRRLRKCTADRATEALKLTGLNGASARAVTMYSGGMTQRLALAVALLPQSDVLLLDEPTAALDPDGTCAFYGLIEHGRANGQTVLFSSHQMGDVERLADRFIVLIGGPWPLRSRRLSFPQFSRSADSCG